MILLKKEYYHKLTRPLAGVTTNSLFARSVVEKHVSGRVYVDNEGRPNVFYVVHPYGMSLLFGDWNIKRFNASFHAYSLNIHGTRNAYEWMQAFPDNWDAVLARLYGDNLIKSSDNVDHVETGIVELNTRVNFKFNPVKYLEQRQHTINPDVSVLRTDGNVFTDMSGSVVPSDFWDTAEDFLARSVGFSVFHQNKLAATAFCSYIHDAELELGIETIEEFRGKGYAQLACSALIDYCLENNYEPVWSCRFENIGSYKLALKLGFEPTLTLPYYRLSK